MPIDPLSPPSDQPSLRTVRRPQPGPARPDLDRGVRSLIDLSRAASGELPPRAPRHHAIAAGQVRDDADILERRAEHPRDLGALVVADLHHQPAPGPEP